MDSRSETLGPRLDLEFGETNLKKGEVSNETASDWDLKIRVSDLGEI